MLSLISAAWRVAVRECKDTVCLGTPLVKPHTSNRVLLIQHVGPLGLTQCSIHPLSYWYRINTNQHVHGRTKTTSNRSYLKSTFQGTQSTLQSVCACVLTPHPLPVFRTHLGMLTAQSQSRSGMMQSNYRPEDY
jgi:hypothetical protein